MAEIILKHKNLIWKIHDHDSLLENQVDEHLTEEQRKEAWEEFENEKKGIVNMASSATLNTNLLMQMQNVQPEMIKVNSRRHGQVCLINPNVLGAVLPRTAISAWAPRKLGLILMTVGV